MTRLPRFVALALCLLLGGIFVVGHLGVAGDKKDKDVKKDAPKEKKDDAKKDEAKKDKDAKDKLEPPKKEPFKADAALKEFKGHSSSIHALVYSGDGKSLASAGNDRTVRVWDAESGKEVVLKGHPREVRGVAFLDGGKVAAVTGDWNKKKMAFEGEIRIWNLAGAKVDRTITGHDSEIQALAVSADGKLLATASDDQTVIIWDLAGKAVQTLKGHTGGVAAVAFSGDGKRVATASADRTVKVWDIEGGKLVHFLFGKDLKDEVKKEDPKVDPKKKKDKKEAKKDAVKKDDAKKEDAKKDGKKDDAKKDAAKDKDGKKDDAKKDDAKKDDAKKDMGKKDDKTPEPVRAFTCVAFSRDGKHIAAGNLNGVIKIWDAESGKELHTLKGHEGVWAVAFSPDGTRLATGGWDQRIKVWDARSGKEVQSINAHNHTVTALVFHPKEARLASAGFDGLVKIWQLK